MRTMSLDFGNPSVLLCHGLSKQFHRHSSVVRCQLTHRIRRRVQLSWLDKKPTRWGQKSFIVLQFFLRLPKPGGKPGIFWFFSYFLTQAAPWTTRLLHPHPPQLSHVWFLASGPMSFGAKVAAPAPASLSSFVSFGFVELDPVEGHVLERVGDEVAHPVRVVEDVAGGHFRVLLRRDFLPVFTESVEVEVQAWKVRTKLEW